MGNLDPWPQWAVMKALEPTDEGTDEKPDGEVDRADDDWGQRWRLEEPVDLGQMLAAALWPLALFLGLVVYALILAH